MVAKYRYKQLINGEFITCVSLVEIVRNDTKTYLVRCLDYCRTYAPGHLLRVRKKNIIF